MSARSAYAVFLVVMFACASAPDAEAPNNRLINGSFEQGRVPWFGFERPDKPYWGGFDISDVRAYDGRHSLRVDLDSENFPGGTGIVGAAQNERPLPGGSLAARHARSVHPGRRDGVRGQ